MKNELEEFIYKNDFQDKSSVLLPSGAFSKKKSKRGKELLILVRDQKVRVDVHCIAVMILSVSSVPALCFLTTPQA